METAPKLNHKAICVTNDPVLAAVISSHFSQLGQYFVVLPFVTIEEPPTSVTARIITDRIKVHIQNRIIEFQPEHVILAGLNTFQKSCLKIPAKYIIEIKSVDDVDAKLKHISQAKNEIVKCRSEEICLGLFIAKKFEHKLIIDNKADDLILPTPAAADGIFLIEKGTDIPSICSINLAHAAGADINFLPSISKKQAYSIKNAIEKAGNGEEGGNFQSLIEDIQSLVKNINLNGYKWITCLTQGIPYTLALGEKHAVALLYRPPAPLTIFDVLYKEQFSSFFYSALIFSTPINESDRVLGITSDETVPIAELFAKNGYLVTPLEGNRATKRNFDNFVAYFPYDVLHIGSHGGGLDGTFNRITINDIDGHKHIFEYYRALDFEPLEEIGEDGKPLIAVVSLIVPHTYDGYIWGELPEDFCPNASKAVEDFITNSLRPELKDDFSVAVTGRIPHSKYIQCIDNIHQGQFQVVAGQTSPFIFNNSCCSWYDMGTSFLGVGALGYIGTLWNIGTDTAKECSEEFYRLALNRKLNLMRCHREMLKSIKNPRYKNIYIYWGLPWLRIHKRPIGSPPASLRVIKNIKQQEKLFERLGKEPGSNKKNEDGVKPILKFLRKTRSELVDKFYL